MCGKNRTLSEEVTRFILPPGVCGTSSTSYISFGKRSKLYESPWMALILNTYGMWRDKRKNHQSASNSVNLIESFSYIFHEKDLEVLVSIAVVQLLMKISYWQVNLYSSFIFFYKFDKQININFSAAHCVNEDILIERGLTLNGVRLGEYDRQKFIDCENGTCTRAMDVQIQVKKRILEKTEIIFFIFWCINTENNSSSRLS